MSGGGDSTTVTKAEPPDYAKPYNEQFLQRGTQLSNQPYQAYSGQRVAGTNPLLNAAYQGVANTASAGNPALNAANDYLHNSIYDNYLNSATQMAGQSNPYMGQTTAVGTNPYAGMNNPYLDAAVGATQQDMVNTYNMTTNPMFDRMQRQSGAFGNSGIQQMRNKSINDLTNSLGNVSNQMRMQDYGQQQQLAEAGLNRNVQARQTDLARNAGLYTDQQNRQLNAWQNERNNQLQAMGMAPSLAQADYLAPQMMAQFGKDYREMEQQNLNSAYDAWTQAQEAPLRNLEILGKTISGSMGGGNTFTTTPQNMAANLMGLGLGGYGLASTMGLLGG